MRPTVHAATSLLAVAAVSPFYAHSLGQSLVWAGLGVSVGVAYDVDHFISGFLINREALLEDIKLLSPSRLYRDMAVPGGRIWGPTWRVFIPWMSVHTLTLLIILGVALAYLGSYRPPLMAAAVAHYLTDWVSVALYFRPAQYEAQRRRETNPEHTDDASQ